MIQYLSKEKLESLKEAIKELKTVKRIEVAEKLKKAKEYGDLSENAEYSEAIEKKEELEMQIIKLEDIIKNAVIIKKKHQTGVVEIGSTVEVEKNGQKRKFVIIGSAEANPETGLISNESPLGLALLGKKVGEKIIVKTISGEIIYKIVKIE